MNGAGLQERNIKLTVAYDGTNYHGFQEQRGSGLPTVQEVLEKAISALAGERVRVIGAGRTDAGVHARGQVVNFKTSCWPIPVERIPLALNGRLPPDIVILAAEEVPPHFHARYSARAKVYRYSVLNRRVPDPFLRHYAYFEPRPLNIEAMQKAASFLCGQHDFAAFRASGATARGTVRTIYRAEVSSSEDGLVQIELCGDGFLYNMVRIIAGTLLEVGLGKLRIDDIKTIIAGRDRKRAGPTLPAHGLCLLRVEY